MQHVVIALLVLMGTAACIKVKQPQAALGYVFVEK